MVGRTSPLVHHRRRLCAFTVAGSSYCSASHGRVDLGQSSNWAPIIGIGGAHAGVAAVSSTPWATLATYPTRSSANSSSTASGGRSSRRLRHHVLLSAGVWFFIDPQSSFTNGGIRLIL